MSTSFFVFNFTIDKFTIKYLTKLSTYYFCLSLYCKLFSCVDGPCVNYLKKKKNILT